MQDYANALTDLRNQMGVPESAGTAEPLGEFILPGNIPPIEEQALIQIALQNRPDLFAARAAVRRRRGRRPPGQGGPDPDPDRRPALPERRGRRPVPRASSTSRRCRF